MADDVTIFSTELTPNGWFAPETSPSGWFHPDLQDAPASGGAACISASQTLDALSQTASIAVRASLSASQSLGGLSQTATIGARASISASQSLDTVSQSASIVVDAVASGISAAQTLDGVSQSASISAVQNTPIGRSGVADGKHRRRYVPIREKQDKAALELDAFLADALSRATESAERFKSARIRELSRADEASAALAKATEGIVADMAAALAESERLRAGIIQKAIAEKAMIDDEEDAIAVILLAAA